MKILSIIVIMFIAAGALFTSSCSHYPTNPQPKCDTCCDTCHTDTTQHPCDTCNIDRDSAAHAFVWTEYNIPGETSLTGVWVFGPDNIVIMGNNLWQYDGTTFTKTHTKDLKTGLSLDNGWNGTGIFAFSPTDYWGFYSSAVYHTDDGWVFDFQQPGGTFNAGWGTSSNDMFFVGNSGQIHHYNGTKFTDMISPTTKDLHKVWGSSASNVWASGFDPSSAASVLIHYDGTTWKEVVLSTIGDIRPFSHALEEVWACDSNGHSVVIAGGSLLWKETDNLKWRSDSGLITNRLNDGSFIGLFHIRGNNANDIVATGDGGFISHWNGKTWFRYDKLYNPGDGFYLTNAVSIKSNTICVVGKKSGSSWVAIGRRK